MKSIFQLFLLALIIFIGYLFYTTYFLDNKNTSKKIIKNNDESKNTGTVLESNISENSDENEIENNQIKNLLYKVDFSESGKYEIQAKLSKLNYAGGIEKVSMLDVSAYIIDKDNNRIDIKSKNALLNTATYKTSFFGDVQIKYLGSLITSEKLDFNFNQNYILISENILYKSLNTKIKADNIKINLLTKEIEVFMDNSQDKIELVHIK